jgi:hypothetical protein
MGGCTHKQSSAALHLEWIHPLWRYSHPRTPKQIEQMAFGREDYAVARPNGGADSPDWTSP